MRFCVVGIQAILLIHWFHRLINSAAVNGMSLSSDVGGQGWNMTCSAEPTSTGQITNPGTFHSWVHPQSTLPRAVISALTSAPGESQQSVMTFIFLSATFSCTTVTWSDEIAFVLGPSIGSQTLKYVFPCYASVTSGVIRLAYSQILHALKSSSSLSHLDSNFPDLSADLGLPADYVHYAVCVMFTAFDGLKKTKGSCRAYISQSTRNFRSLLKEHARPMESMTGVDNTPQSLLMCTGSKNVHAIYDLLLNYRSFLTSLTGADVPVLYSPVPFQNAALSTPEVRCKQVRKVDYISSQLHDSNMDSEPNRTSCAASAIVLKLGIPISRHGFATESMSIGLNVGLDVARDQTAQLTKADEPLQESGQTFDIPNTTLSLRRNSAFLKGLKYGCGSYTAFLSPVE
ncbi:hypothetical protein Sango_1499900 [Sesamum angolense]|uniref:Uncharacterized protein n=1 Tax=Sesamum angolense TaxID=2727404 RepID=A0AAE2BT51_9LAMI|nr:hypothetical protein Sango_1499900 [Sesamum angolense]